ncbi:FtsX-like permease family protein [Marinomonas sp. 15G1-11]|uniref:FtsX-like permease family protein n=1 Tax=Marinomonas phaeophyticola TaxID=3004091 RepID=A0ABT4JPL1_9GAMM|nr:FtsX-like permease family protein [Marinomonas sp. 15G1-11]MCZ2720294.1 FtsX-like permease family protein [Marinomonas sp. 15G1-11]
MLAVKLLIREIRNGDVLTLLFALILSVSTVTGIDLFVDRLQTSFTIQSATLLAADRVVRSNTAITNERMEYAKEQGLETAQKTSFSSMVFSNEGLQLSQLSAVTGNYPLRGSYLVDDDLFGAGYSVEDGPSEGDIWVSSRLASLLGVGIGDAVQVGETDLTIRHYLVRDPGSTGSAFAIAPRAVINQDDLLKTQVIQPGSRVRYSLLLAGNEDALNQYEAWITPNLEKGERWRTPKSGGQGINSAIERAESFLLLAGTLAVVMSGVAMALASSRYVRRHLTQVAVIKTLGATPKKIAQLLLSQLAIIFLVGTGLGLLLGWLIQEVIALSLASLLSTVLPAASISNLWLGMVTGLMSLFAFCLPLLMRLFDVSPLTVLHPAGKVQLKSLQLYIIALTGMYLLMVVYTGGLLLPSIMIAAIFMVAVAIGIIGYGLFKLGRVLTSGAVSGWQIGLASLHRRLMGNLFQLLVFTLIIMLGLILIGVKSSLISDWQRQLPVDAPNHYLFNVQEGEVKQISDIADNLQIPVSEWYPMVRGRVVQINGQDADLLYTSDDKEPELLSREMNLTWSNELAEDNVLLEGEFGGNVNGLSIEEEVAKEIGLKIGDTLGVKIGGLDYQLPITSIRSVDWSSMRPNFYLILPQSILSDFPANYVSSVFIDKDNVQSFYKKMADFPTVSMLNVGDLIQQIQLIIAQVSQAIQLVLFFILSSAVLVLNASVRASLDERLEEGALLRTLGASKTLIRQSMLVEFGFLGFSAGVIGALAAELSLFGLQVFVFELAPSFHPLMWFLGPMTGFVVVSIIGLYAGKSVLTVPPMRMLRSL